MSEDVISAYGAADETMAENLAGVPPLPWRQCAPLIFFASAACYALGYLVVAVFDHLLAAF